MNRSVMIGMVGLLGGVFLVFGGGQDGDKPQPIGDVLAACHKSDRLSKTSILFGMAEKEFGSDTEQADWWNTEVDAARAVDFQPFVDAVAEAIEADTVKQLAEQLEVSR